MLQPETTLELRILYDKYVMGFFGLPNPLPTARFGKALKVSIVQQCLYMAPAWHGAARCCQRPPPCSICLTPCPVTVCW